VPAAWRIASAAMNYRHAFHAGGFADVVKHSVLALLIERLKLKGSAFRVIDTHAGIGMYDLAGSAAKRSGEWQDGIARLWQRDLDPALAALLAPWLDSVKAANGGRNTLRSYPGSPWIARHLFRRQDRLTAVELHPDDARTLAELFAGDIQVRTIALDGWLALGAFVPPKERRGLVLVDPPYEETDEFAHLLDSFINAHRRWPTGIFCLWYPVKDIAAVDSLRIGLAKSGIRRLLRAELTVRERGAGGTFNGTGLVICNPPWQFGDALSGLLAGLVPVLAQGDGAGHILDEIAGE
jgi:23S rRNA (adenine2030-N6)-methyltransferase